MRTAERAGARIGTKGTGCSYTDVVSPSDAARERIVELFDLRTTTVDEIDARTRSLRRALRDDVTSVLTRDVQLAYLRHTHLRSRTSLTDVRSRLSRSGRERSSAS